MNFQLDTQMFDKKFHCKTIYALILSEINLILPVVEDTLNTQGAIRDLDRHCIRLTVIFKLFQIMP